MQKKETPFEPGCFLFFILNIFHDITRLAGQDSTEHLNGMGTDAFIPFDSCNLSGTDVMLLYKCILADPFFFHYFP